MTGMSKFTQDRPRRLGVLASGAMLAAIAFPAGPTLTAVAAVATVATNQPAIPNCAANATIFAPGDIDGDAVSDVVVGLPNAGPSTALTSGAVDIHYSSAPAQRIVEDTLDGTVTPTAGDAFGSAVAVGQFLGADLCSDVAIGAPGRGGAGAVVLAQGDATGLLTTGVQTLHGMTGDRFGAALAIKGSDLWIGAPGRTVNGRVGAGAVIHYRIESGVAHLLGTITQSSAGIAGIPEAGDGFGSSLAANAAGVVIGVPGEDVGTAKDAGAVTFLDTNTHQPSSTWTQNSPGVAGVAESGDRFGAAVAMDPGGAEILIGVPGEDVGTLKDAGMAQSFGFRTGTLKPQMGITQDSPGIPGTAEAGDRFGASVALGEDLFCYSSIDGAIGAPGESVGSIQQAGSVTLVSLQGENGECKARALTQGASGGLGGAVETGDQVGAALSVRGGSRADDSDGEDIHDVLLIGVPFEDVGTVHDAGLVIEKSIRATGGGANVLDRFTDSRGAQTDADFGSVIAPAQT